MKNKIRTILNGKEIKFFCYLTILILYLVAFICDNPIQLLKGLIEIIQARDLLTTDYFELVGYGSTFLNAALVGTIVLIAIEIERIPYTGLTIAALFINLGFALWGKNCLNILPILLGTYIYAHLQGSNFGRYIYTALFATCLAPFVTEIYYMIPLHPIICLVASICCGVIIGFIIPPVAAHTTSIHMGYSLFNGGFAGGILAFILTSGLRSFGFEISTVLIWKEGINVFLLIGLVLYFIFAFLFGLWLEYGNIHQFNRITRHPGRAVADFVLMDSPGATLMNMGFMGLFGLSYVLIVRGDLSGPIVGCIFTVFGFSAFGAHPKNYAPVLFGVFISTLFTKYHANDPGLLIAALFAVGLSPIAGQFGFLAGIIAGILHSFVVVCTSSICGGYNLYNNGFAMGFVAILLIPLIESFMKHFKLRKKGNIHAS